MMQGKRRLGEVEGTCGRRGEYGRGGNRHEGPEVERVGEGVGDMLRGWKRG